MIELHINGSDLMLSGRFDSWQSRLSMGPDLDDLGIQIAVDATSGGAHPALGQVANQLFSFRSHDVVPVAAGIYRVTGQFSGAGNDSPRQMEMQLETSTEHTPTFVIAFAAKKGDFGDEWTRLIANDEAPSPSNDNDGPVRAAQAWLTPPELAAA